MTDPRKLLPNGNLNSLTFYLLTLSYIFIHFWFFIKLFYGFCFNNIILFYVKTINRDHIGAFLCAVRSDGVSEMIGKNCKNLLKYEKIHVKTIKLNK